MSDPYTEDPLDWHLGHADEYYEPADPSADDVQQQAWADKLLAALGYRGRKILQAQELANIRRADITDWEETTVGRHQLAVANLTAQLESWTRAQHKEHPQTKTWPLPHGDLKIRGGRNRVDVDARWPSDDDAARALQEAPAGRMLVQIKTTVAKQAVAKVAGPGAVVDDYPDTPGYIAHYAVTTSGEVLPGVAILVPTEDTFQATPRV